MSPTLFLLLTSLWVVGLVLCTVSIERGSDTTIIPFPNTSRGCPNTTVVDVSDKLSDFLTMAITSCGVKSVAVVADDRFEDYLYAIAQRLNLPLVFRDADATVGLGQWIRTAYVEDRVDYFLLASPDPGHILREAEAVFDQEAFGHLALFPHLTRWLVIAWTDRQARQVARQQFRSVLDNVAVVQVTSKTNWTSPVRMAIEHVTTFMWRAYRTREPEHVAATRTGGSTRHVSCSLVFPNKDFGLNQRNLAVAVKKYRSAFFNTGLSPETGRLEAGGILIDALKMAAESQNFTYALVPDIGSPLGQQMAWADYLAMVDNGSVAIGLTPWSILNQIMYPHLSFSYPLIFDKIVGVYRRPPRKAIYNSLFFLCPFPFVVYLFLVGCLIYTATLYTTVVNVIYFSCQSDVMRGCYPCDGKLSTSRTTDSARPGENGDKTGGRCVHLLTHHVSQFLATLSLFVASLLNQPYLPRPRPMSARILVGVWAIGVVIFNAVFCSSITAEMIRHRQNVPFTTIEQLLEQHDYTVTTIQGLYFNGTDTKTVSRLQQRSTIVNLSNHGSIDTAINTLLNSLGHKQVLFYYQAGIENWLHDRNKTLDDFVLMDTDPLFRSDVGIVFPGGSQLRELISNVFVSFFDSGLDERLYKTYEKVTHKMTTWGSSSTKKIKPMEIESVFWLSAVCGGCLLISACALVLETLAYRHAWHRQWDERTTKESSTPAQGAIPCDGV